MDKYSKLLVLIAILMSLNVYSQKKSSERTQLPVDTLTSDSVRALNLPSVKQIPDSLPVDTFKPNPKKNLWMGVIIPGYGQILNRKYWKLPLVYGGFLACAYAISWNSSQYNSYKTAYRDITDRDETTNSFLDILPKGRTVKDFGGVTQYTAALKKKQDSFRRYRDLSIFATIGFYAITLVDAYVDAQLYDFDISPSLSMHVQPAVMKNSFGLPSSLGLQFCLNLR